MTTSIEESDPAVELGRGDPFECARLSLCYAVLNSGEAAIKALSKLFGQPAKEPLRRKGPKNTTAKSEGHVSSGGVDPAESEFGSGPSREGGSDSCDDPLSRGDGNQPLDVDSESLKSTEAMVMESSSADDPIAAPSIGKEEHVDTDGQVCSPDSEQLSSDGELGDQIGDEMMEKLDNAAFSAPLPPQMGLQRQLTVPLSPPRPRSPQRASTWSSGLPTRPQYRWAMAPAEEQPAMAIEDSSASSGYIWVLSSVPPELQQRQPSGSPIDPNYVFALVPTENPPAEWPKCPRDENPGRVYVLMRTCGPLEPQLPVKF